MPTNKGWRIALLTTLAAVAFGSPANAATIGIQNDGYLTYEARAG
jgi:hypothetical protein